MSFIKTSSIRGWNCLFLVCLVYTKIMLEKYLQELGLSEKEAQIYLALLQVDNESIQDLAKRTEINRTTVYPVLETLEKKGLVSEVQIGKKTHYEAAAPERLETFVERQRAVLEERSQRLKDIIPQIKSIQREEGERPVIKYFEGRDGLISAYEEFYGGLDTSKREGYFIYNRDLINETFTHNEQEKFAKIRLGKEVFPVTVYTYNSDFAFKTKGERVKVDQSKYPILADITIIDDKIMACTLNEKVSSVLIHSKDLAITIGSLVKYINDSKK